MIFSSLKNRDDNKAKVIKNVAWAMLGKLVNMLGVLLVGILVARYLGPEQYGLMNYVISYVTLFTVIATFGLENIEIREMSKAPDRKNFVMGTCFGIRLFFAVVSYLLIGITLLVTDVDSFTATMILLYASVLFTSCFGVIRNYFSSIIKNEYIVKSEIARTVIGAIIKIVLLWAKAPLEWFIIATAFDTVLVSSGYILSYTKCAGSMRDWRFEKASVKFYITQAFPLVLSGATVIIYQRIDQVMIGNMLNNEEVGYFATAGKFLDLVLFLPTVISQTVVPILVKCREQNPEEYEQKAKQFVSIVVWISVFLSLAVSLSAYWLIYLTYGVKYLSAVPVLQILAWKTIGMGLSSSGGQLIIIEKNQKWAVIRNLAGCVTCVALNYLLIPRMGIIGSAWVTIITVLVSGCFANILIPPYRHIFKIEMYAVFKGWRHLLQVKSILSRN